MAARFTVNHIRAHSLANLHRWKKLLTSLPAKREIAFRLDGTRYAAQVAMTANAAKVVSGK